MSAATLAAYFLGQERRREEKEKMEKALQNRIAAMTPEEKDKYLSDEKKLDGFVTLFATLLILTVSIVFLWFFI